MEEEEGRRVLFLKEKYMALLLDGRKIKYVHVESTSPLVLWKHNRYLIYCKCIKNYNKKF